MLAVLCLMILHYEIEVTEDPKYGAETFEERKARVMKAGMHVITLVAEKIPLTLQEAGMKEHRFGKRCCTISNG